MDKSEWVKQEILKMTDDECNVFLALLQHEMIKRGEVELARAHSPHISNGACKRLIKRIRTNQNKLTRDDRQLAEKVIQHIRREWIKKD